MIENEKNNSKNETTKDKGTLTEMNDGDSKKDSSSTEAEKDKGTLGEMNDD